MASVLPARPSPILTACSERAPPEPEALRTDHAKPRPHREPSERPRGPGRSLHSPVWLWPSRELHEVLQTGLILLQGPDAVPSLARALSRTHRSDGSGLPGEKGLSWLWAPLLQAQTRHAVLSVTPGHHLPAGSGVVLSDPREAVRMRSSEGAVETHPKASRGARLCPWFLVPSPSCKSGGESARNQPLR